MTTSVGPGLQRPAARKAVALGERSLPARTSGLVDAYQLAAQEIERVQRLPWPELTERSDAPWVFGAGELDRLTNANGRLTIVNGFDGDPETKQIIVALEWQHERQGRRNVRLVTLVNRPA